MNTEYNSQYFSKEQVEAGELNSFLTCLMNQCYGKGTTYNDIHIKPADCNAFIIEWAQVDWQGQYGGHFEYLEENQEIFTEYKMPDGTYQYFMALEDFEEACKEQNELN